MKHIAATLASLIVIAVSVSAQTGVLMVSSYGAKCNGSGNDAPAFQAAANAAHSLYVSTQAPVTVTYAGNCQLEGSIWVQSGVHWRGYGAITVPTQPMSCPSQSPASPVSACPVFYATNADNVEWDHIKISITTPGIDHPYSSGIGWFASNDSSQHTHVKIINSTLFNFAWGISVLYNDGGSSGNLTDVEVASDTVSSQVSDPTTFSTSTWDGIHVGGSVTNVRIHDNTVTNRGDAAIALTTECYCPICTSSCTPDNAAHETLFILSGATIENNTALQDKVGIDISGAHDVDVSGNFVQETNNPSGVATIAFRQIFYNDYPVDVHTLDNYFETVTGTNGYAVKIDPAVARTPLTWGPPLDSAFENNIIAGPPNLQITNPPNPLYVRGDSIIVTGNSFVTSPNGGSQLDVDQFGSLATSNVIIGTNRWIGNYNYCVNIASIQNVKMASQAATGTINGPNCTIPSNVQMIPN